MPCDSLDARRRCNRPRAGTHEASAATSGARARCAVGSRGRPGGDAAPAPPRAARQAGRATRPRRGHARRSRRRARRAAGAARRATADADALVKQYCATCHSDRGKAGGLSLAGFDAAQAREQRRRRREDDPQAARRHDAAGRRASGPDGATLAGARRRARDADRSRARRSTRIPGWRPFQRLNRAEYARAVKDLLGLDVDVTAFPAARHDQRRLRQRRRRADVLADADGGLPARGQPDQPPRGRRSRARRRRRPPTSVPQTASQMRARRGRAVRHARRHLGRAHLPGRRRLRLPA